MNAELFEYDITPKILPSGLEQRVAIRPISPNREFDENTIYTIRVFPMTEVSTLVSTFEVQARPVNGVLSFCCAFPGEQEHSVRIFRPGEEKAMASLAVYSLYPDLMERIPLMGDFHAHSCRSDGRESPAFVSAMYRQHGFDFAPITDHGMYYPSQEAIDAYQNVEIDFQIYPGEEVHTPGNNVHIINFAGSFSVNELAKHGTNRLWSCDPRQEWMDEVNRLVSSLPDPPKGVDKFVWASCMLIYQKIREGGGMSIFCHPYWISDVYNVNAGMTRKICSSTPLIEWLATLYSCTGTIFRCMMNYAMKKED